MLAYESSETKEKSYKRKFLLGFYLLKDFTKVDSFTHNY